jgi:hypothetical protein
MSYDDSDVFKVIEGASYSLALQPDPKLDAYLDALIVNIAAAQEADGYLFTARRLLPPDKMPGTSGQGRWVDEKESHELYNAGHLYEAATAYYQATGKRKLLDIALRSADLLDRTFAPAKRSIWPGHQVTEMGLVKLYRVTGEQSYLDLSRFLLECRGRGKVKSALTMSVEIQRKLAEILKKRPRDESDFQLRIQVHPTVLERLRTEDEKLLIEMEKRYFGKLSFRADAGLHAEQFKIVNVTDGEEMAASNG